MNHIVKFPILALFYDESQKFYLCILGVFEFSVVSCLGESLILSRGKFGENCHRWLSKTWKLLKTRTGHLLKSSKMRINYSLPSANFLYYYIGCPQKGSFILHKLCISKFWHFWAFLDSWLPYFMDKWNRIWTRSSSLCLILWLFQVHRS